MGIRTSRMMQSTHYFLIALMDNREDQRKVGWVYV